MTASLQPTILRFDSIDSTNLEAARQARAGAAQGVCIFAREQTRGRGRLDRTWQSPKDSGLYLSIILRPKFAATRWPLITLMAALAVSDALRSSCDLKVDIKWPNDICFQEKKLCGILAETVETVDGSAVVLGIGINLNAEGFPPELKSIATSVEQATGLTPDRDVVLNELVRAVGRRYDSLQSDGGAEQTIREWCANSSYAFGRRVHVALGNETFEGTTRGLEGDGALRVEVGEGNVKIVRAGDVTALRPQGIE